MPTQLSRWPMFPLLHKPWSCWWQSLQECRRKRICRSLQTVWLHIQLYTNNKSILIEAEPSLLSTLSVDPQLKANLHNKWMCKKQKNLFKEQNHLTNKTKVWSDPKQLQLQFLPHHSQDTSTPKNPWESMHRTALASYYIISQTYSGLGVSCVSLRWELLDSLEKLLFTIGILLMTDKKLTIRELLWCLLFHLRCR